MRAERRTTADPGTASARECCDEMGNMRTCVGHVGLADTCPVLFEFCVEALGMINDRFVGRPCQRRRADRLIAEDRVRSILFDADAGLAVPVP